MEFRILGPLEIAFSGQTYTVQAAKHRAVLAVLLLHANRTVSMAGLIDMVWGERPPNRAEVTIRNYICRIRKLLPAQVLCTTSAGYQVKLAPENLDLNRFQDLVTRARQARVHRPADTAAALGEALALWRGPALADLGDAPIQQVEAPRLEELRLAAVEDLIDAELRLGRHAELVPELRGLVARHPLRERLVGQLMLALHRCGRRTEAIAVYRQAHDTVARELGLAPGRDLRRLRQQIVDDTPVLVPVG